MDKIWKHFVVKFEHKLSEFHFYHSIKFQYACSKFVGWCIGRKRLALKIMFEE